MTLFVHSLPYAAVLGLCTFFYFAVYPIVVYFRDVKGECIYIPNDGYKLTS
jgi:hypothetical protein